MKKHRNMLPVAAGLAAAYLPLFAWAATSTDENIGDSALPVEHVIVSMPAHRHDARTAMPVDRIDGDALRRVAAATLGETLSRTPGLVSADFGPAVGQPVIRGQQGPRVLVLQNSLPTLDVASNSADHALSVEPVLAEGIEILRGSSTLLYGGGAIGGVVNVLDGRIPARQIDGLSGAAELRHSSVDNGRVGVMRLDGGDGQWGFHAAGLYRDWGEPEISGLAINPANVAEIDNNSDGVLANADGRNRQFTLGGARHFDAGYWGLSYSELRNGYGIPAGVHQHHGEEHGEAELDPEPEEGLRLSVAQTRWELAGDLHLEGLWEMLRWRFTHSDYQHVELEADGEAGTRFAREGLAGRLELSHSPVGSWHGVVGLQWLDSDFAARGEEAFVPATSNRNVGVFWLEDYHGGEWQIEMGIRGEWDKLSPDDGLSDRDYASISASLGGVYDLNPNWSLSLSLAESRRAPVAEELYANARNSTEEYVVHGATGLIEVGDSELRREKANTTDVGVNMDYGRLTAELSLFYYQFTNFTYLADTGDEVEGTRVLAYRQRDAHFRGLEYQLGYLLWDGAGQLRATLFGDRVRGRVDNGGDIPRQPPRRDGLRMAWEQGAWRVEMDYLRVAAQNHPGPFEMPTDAYTRVDASLSWRGHYAEQHYTLSLRARNLGDEEIRNASSPIRDYAPEPGRSIELSVRIDFGSSGE